MIKRIALTGGPAAGKSTILKKLKKELKNKYEFIPEVATELLKTGRYSLPNDREKFQDDILKVQYRSEMKMKTNYVADRGIYDGIAYDISIFDKIKNRKLWIHYDIVFILKTTAVNPNLYNKVKGTNEVRGETAEEALKVQRKLESVYRKIHKLGYIKKLVIFKLEDLDKIYNKIRKELS